MPGQIFISHSEHDKPFAEAMLKALEDRGMVCWIAPRDIRPGGSYADAILTAIEGCHLFVLIYTDHCNKSGHVLREVERALNFEINIVPVRFDESTPSKGLDYLLATVHWLSVPAESRSAAVEHAAAQIAACLQPVAQQDPTSTIQPFRAMSATPVASRKVTHRDLKIVWIALGVLLLGAFVALGIIFVNASRQRHPAETAISQSPASDSVKPPSASASASASVSASPPISAPSPSQPPAQMAEQAPPQPAVTAISANEPQGILHQYFACFRTRDVAGAYNRLSARFRARLSFEKFSKTFASTRDIRLIEVKQSSGTSDSATIDVFFEETDAAWRRVQWRGPIKLVRESGGWRIETLKGLKSSSGNAADTDN